MHYDDGNFMAPVAIGPLHVIQPFEGDTASTILEQDFMVDATRFDRMPLDTPHEERPDHYLVRESDPRSIGQGLFEFTRQWAKVPGGRIEYETHVYRVPGIEGAVAGDTRNIVGSSTFGGVLTLTTATAHTFDAGDPVRITYVVTDTESGINIPRNVGRTVLSVPDTTHVTVGSITDSAGPMTLNQILPASAGRAPLDRTVLSLISLDYFLPGVSQGIASARDIEVFEPLRPIGADGDETDLLSATTSPTASEYRALVTAGTLVVAEPSIIRRWRGNIYERATRYVRAI